MRICTLRNGDTYVGTGDFYTVEEWSDYLSWVFDNKQDKAYTSRIPGERAKALGATRSKASCFECGPGYIFGNDSEESLRERAVKLFPQLF